MDLNTLVREYIVEVTRGSEDLNSGSNVNKTQGLSHQRRHIVKRHTYLLLVTSIVHTYSLTYLLNVRRRSKLQEIPLLLF